VGKRKSPDFAASSVSDRIAFAYSSSRNRTAHVPSREKLGIYRFHFRAVRSLQSGLSTNNREIRALFAYFSAERAKILCSSDCMAERAGFEPSVRFCRAKPRRVRKLQITKPCQRISPEIRPQNWAISPVSIRHLFVRERRRQGDSVAKGGHFARPQAARLGSHVTACLACSHKTEGFSGGKNYLRRGFLVFFDFYARALSAIVASLPTSHSGPASVTLSELHVTLAQSGQAR
jgi:hypothetical protein